MKTIFNVVWWQKVAPFYLLHLIVIGLCFVVPVTDEAIAWGIGFFFLREFGITAGYHRYFSHRSFKTSRVMQFVFALIGSLAVQQGPLWWGAHHRRHHKYSATEKDIHSPEQHGFWWAHVGWTLSMKYNDSDLSNIKDLTKYPELVLLDRLYMIPAIVVGFVVWGLLGSSVLVVGYLLSLIFNYHCTFFINSLCHMFGNRRFKTTDDSRNSFLLALVTLGEGWHNNHHYYQQSVRQGMYWWELDVTYIILKIMSWLGLVWDFKTYPERLYKEAQEQRLHPKNVDYKWSPKTSQNF